MLVLSRRQFEKIIINDDITITVLRISGSRVQIAIEAPVDVRIRRNELVRKEPKAKKAG